MTFANPYIPDINNILGQHQRGMQVGGAMRQQNALTAAGQAFTQGDQKGTVNALAGAGMLDQAMAAEGHFKEAAREADAAKLAKVQQFNNYVGNIGLAINNLPPDARAHAWREAVTRSRKAGVKLGPEYDDFGMFDVLMARTGKTGEIIANEYKRRELEAKGAGGGGLMNVPPGNVVLDKTTMQPVFQAPDKPGGGKNFTDGQTKAANFANMMVTANQALDAVAPKGPDGKPLPLENPKNFLGAVRDGVVPFSGLRNTMMPDETQTYNQTAEQWIRAKLRKESGAVIGEEEMAQEFRTYFPQYGDGPDVRARKAAARAEATKGMLAESGGAYQELFGQAGQQTQAPPPAGQAQPSAVPGGPVVPQPGQIEDGYRFKGGDPSNRVNWERVQ